jgi:SAM-dependent methyltransferase
MWRRTPDLPEILKNRFKRWLWPLMPGWPDEGRRIVQGPHLRTLLARAIDRARGFPCVFNAGAGEGGYSNLLLALPKVRTIVETDLAWTATKPQRVDPRQVFFCGSLTSIPLLDNGIDFVLCTEVLEHIADHDAVLDEIARVLAPGGWLLVTVPTPPAVPDPMHAREGYRHEELEAMLTHRGFDVIASRQCMYLFFRLLLKQWPTVQWRPRILIRALALLDRLCPVGPPMDLMILARLRNDGRTS